MLLTIKEVAAHLKISLSLAYGLTAKGTLVCHRIGTGRGAIRVKQEDLDAYLDATRHEPNHDPPVKRRPRLKHIRL